MRIHYQYTHTTTKKIFAIQMVLYGNCTLQAHVIVQLEGSWAMLMLLIVVKPLGKKAGMVEAGDWATIFEL